MALARARVVARTLGQSSETVVHLREASPLGERSETFPVELIVGYAIR